MKLRSFCFVLLSFTFLYAADSAGAGAKESESRESATTHDEAVYAVYTHGSGKKHVQEVYAGGTVQRRFEDMCLQGFARTHTDAQNFALYCTVGYQTHALVDGHARGLPEKYVVPSPDVE